MTNLLEKLRRNNNLLFHLRLSEASRARKTSFQCTNLQTVVCLQLQMLSGKVEDYFFCKVTLRSIIFFLFIRHLTFSMVPYYTEATLNPLCTSFIFKSSLQTPSSQTSRPNQGVIYMIRTYLFLKNCFIALFFRTYASLGHEYA